MHYIRHLLVTDRLLAGLYCIVLYYLISSHVNINKVVSESGRSDLLYCTLRLYHNAYFHSNYSVANARLYDTIGSNFPYKHHTIALANFIYFICIMMLILVSPGSVYSKSHNELALLLMSSFSCRISDYLYFSV